MVAVDHMVDVMTVTVEMTEVMIVDMIVEARRLVWKIWTRRKLHDQVYLWVCGVYTFFTV